MSAQNYVTISLMLLEFLFVISISGFSTWVPFFLNLEAYYYNPEFVTAIIEHDVKLIENEWLDGV